MPARNEASLSGSAGRPSTVHQVARIIVSPSPTPPPALTQLDADRAQRGACAPCGVLAARRVSSVEHRTTA